MCAQPVAAEPACLSRRLKIVPRRARGAFFTRIGPAMCHRDMRRIAHTLNA
jgi:hypothetical protein